MSRNNKQRNAIGEYKQFVNNTTDNFAYEYLVDLR